MRRGEEHSRTEERKEDERREEKRSGEERKEDERKCEFISSNVKLHYGTQPASDWGGGGIAQYLRS